MFNSKEEILSQYELVSYNSWGVESVTLVPKDAFKVDGGQLWVRNEWKMAYKPKWVTIGHEGQGQSTAVFVDLESKEAQAAIDALLGTAQKGIKVWQESDMLRYTHVEFK